MYGEIVSDVPVDLRTGEKIPGDYIVQDEFLADLDEAVKDGCKKITLRMNSLGGDACVSILIHNRLRELAANGTEIICVVDGVAMSGGSLIMCAADTVRVNPSSLIMIHKCWSFYWGAYNADELRSFANSQDAYDKAQCAIYARKTGLSETKILHLMGETTYMTGAEAKEKGFADELKEDAPLDIAASASGGSLFVAGREFHIAPGMKLPDGIPVKAENHISTSNEDDIKNKPADTGSKSKGENPMATNLEELRKENAELAATVESELRAAMSAENTTAVDNAVSAERERIQHIDEIACLYDDETVAKAKYGDPCTAEQMAFRAAVASAKSGSAFMANAKADTKESGVNGVSAASNDGDDSKPQTAEQKQAAADKQIGELLKKEVK